MPQSVHTTQSTQFVSAKKSMRGFTLVEVLIAIAILSIGAVGAMSLVADTTKAGIIASDTLTATYLAQEGIEMVRQQRDSNIIIMMKNYDPVTNTYGGYHWDDDFVQGTVDCSPVAPLAGCSIDPFAASAPYLAECTSFGNCPAIYADNTTKAYTQTTGGTKTRFTREIDVEALSAPIASASSTVSWVDNSGTPHTVTVTEVLTDQSGSNGA